MQDTDYIDKMVDHLIAREGGFSDHRADRGGATRWGITEAVARANGYKGPMAVLPKHVAIAIYRARYWTLPGFDRIHMLAPTLAAELFDTGVNMGPGIAVGFLQRALNALNRGARDYADVAVDRQIGPATIAALSGFLNTRRVDGERVLITAVEALQGERYITLAERIPANEAFVFGWLANRLGNAAISPTNRGD